MTLIEMQGMLSGKCIPGDMLVNESVAAYLLRQLAERDQLRAENSALQLTQQNIINALGITGDGPISKLVIERVLKAEASSTELNAQGCELFAEHCELMSDGSDRFNYTPAAVRWRTAGRAAKEFAGNLRERKL